MPVFCPNCGVMQPEGVAQCANCGKPIPAARAAQSSDEITRPETMAYIGLAFKYTLLPIIITVAVLCAGWLICNNLIR